MPHITRDDDAFWKRYRSRFGVLAIHRPRHHVGAHTTYYTPECMAPFVSVDQTRRQAAAGLRAWRAKGLRIKPRHPARPTFDLLRGSERLRLRNPENGETFTAVLKESLGVLGLRVIPDVRRRHNVYARARMVSRPFVEEWLTRLELIPA